jgi:predicted phosphodiesterase
MRRVDHDLLVCCGDLVVDYPFPEECVAMVRDAAAYVCQGNNDRAIAHGLKASEEISERWRHYAQAIDTSTELTAGLMSEGARAYLKGLPRETGALRSAGRSHGPDGHCCRHAVDTRPPGRSR